MRLNEKRENNKNNNEQQKSMAINTDNLRLAAELTFQVELET